MYHIVLTHRNKDMFIRNSMGSNVYFIKSRFCNPDLLYNAFVHQDSNYTHAYLMNLHDKLNNKKISLLDFNALYLNPYHGCYRLSDKIIQNANLKQLIIFFDELYYLYQNGWFTKHQLFEILLKHERFNEGFSPLHELITLRSYEKLVLYIDNLHRFFSFEELKPCFLKTNKANRTVFQQGINNGVNINIASISMARYFLRLIEPPLFSLHECKIILRSLKCADYKINHEYINHMVTEKYDLIEGLLQFSDSTMRFFDHEEKLDEACVKNNSKEFFIILR